MYRVFCVIALAFSVVVFVAGLQGSAQAGLIVSHTGSSNPTGEGFTLTVGDTQGAFSASTDWGLNDWQMAETAGQNLDYYTHALSSTDLANMSSKGWTATFTMAEDRPNTQGTWASDQEVDTPTRNYVIAVGTDSNHLQSLWTVIGSSFTEVASGYSWAFHTYTLTAAANSTTVTLSVDGTSVGTWAGATGGGGTTGLFEFGRGSEVAPTSTLNFAEASLATATVPEPAALTLLVTGMIALLAYAWRKRK